MYGLWQQDKIWHICNYFENLESEKSSLKMYNVLYNPFNTK